jgi:hypothetical protein
MGKKSRSGSRIRDEHPGSYLREILNNLWVKILEFVDADSDPRSGIFLTYNGWKKLRSPDKNPGSATLHYLFLNFLLVIFLLGAMKQFSTWSLLC